MQRLTDCDVLIVGGGTGGCAAAIAACELGLSVILTEENDWIGGQLTSQLVPPDEHPWIESFGCTRRYRAYRNQVRQYYRDHLPLTAAARQNPRLNPGNGWVSRLCHEPRIGWQVLCQMVQPAITQGRLQLLTRTEPTAVQVNGDTVEAVEFLNRETGDTLIVRAKMVLDATELGDLLPLAGAEYRLGAESQSETGEPNALNGPAEAENVQGITWCAVFALDEGSHRVIDRPDSYAKWRDYRPSNWPGKLFDFIIDHAETGQKRDLPLFGKTPEQHYTLFSYRQIIDPNVFESRPGYHPATVVNWPNNDYFVGTIIDVPPEIKAERLQESRDLTISLLYWLQTEAPRHDGGVGYPGLYLRPDQTGTADGLAQYPYIRESRRMVTRTLVTEQMVAAYTNPGCDRAPDMAQSVGIGSYRIDLHPSTSGARSIDTSTLPFQIPLGSLVPVRMKNLLPGCKNLGVTHITNGCYRLHPVEWNIGEAAGLLAGFSVARGVLPAQVLDTPDLWTAYEKLLTDQGIETRWPVLRAL